MAVIITVPQFPNVPNLPGVPQLVRSLQFPASAPPTLGNAAASNALWASTQTAPMWGVFDSNNVKVLNPDSFMSFSYRHTTNLPDYPIQNGAFGSFNRVSLPFETTVIMTKGGSDQDRNAFLMQVDAIDTGAGALELYTILTADKSYLNCNIMNVEMTRREANNATWFDIELRFRQIFPVAAQYSSSPTGVTTTSLDNAISPAAVPFTNQGLVQPQPTSLAEDTYVQQLLAAPIGGVLDLGLN